MSAPKPMEITRAVERAWKIPGQYRRGEAAFLYELARRKGQIVEIGCYMGRSTAILLQAAAVWGAEVTTIDPFVKLPNDVPEASPQIWRRNLKQQGLTPGTLIVERSHQAVLEWKGEIALLFIDGDHGYEGVRADLEDWTRHVQVGGVVALHDMWFPSITGVAQAVTDWWIRERSGGVARWTCVGMRDLTIAFRRDR